MKGLLISDFIITYNEKRIWNLIVYTCIFRYPAVSIIGGMAANLGLSLAPVRVHLRATGDLGLYDFTHYHKLIC
jgi:hypothetical protein